jgi:hypothetical protein
VAVNASVTISLLIVLSGVSFAFAGQFANPGDAAMVKTLASELGNATVTTRIEDLSNDKRRALAERALRCRWTPRMDGVAVRGASLSSCWRAVV